MKKSRMIREGICFAGIWSCVFGVCITLEIGAPLLVLGLIMVSAVGFVACGGWL